ncbi:MAG: hypothetical protein Q9201_002709 [Fulgogasparrea decipioides]
MDEIKLCLDSGGPMSAYWCGKGQREKWEIFARDGSPSPWAGVGRAGFIEQDPLSVVCIEKIKSWINECDRLHIHCASKQPLSMPTRLVDVSPVRYGKEPFLCISKGEIEKYAALSYVWGCKQSFTTTKHNLAAHLKCLPLQNLPKVFQDTIIVTQMSGIRFVWIDALCIIQGDSEDWERESGQMSSIFGSAYLTISASSANDVDVGFCTLRPTATATEFKYNYYDGYKFSVFARRFLDHLPLGEVEDRTEPEKYPVLGRGWCLQERLLSRRVVHFTKKELLWDCCSSCRCECGAYDRDGRTSRLMYFNRAVREATSILGKSLSDPISSGTNVSKSSKLAPQKELRLLWREIVQSYTMARLTYPSDSLPALSGIAQRLQHTDWGEYLAGLWSADLARQLTWENLFPRASRAYDDYTAPSWSFLCRPGAVEYFDFDFLDEIQYIKILEAKCVPQGLNKTGAIVDGWIKLSAPCATLKVEQTSSQRAEMHALCRTEDGKHVEFIWIPDTDEAAEDVKEADCIYALILFSSYPSSTSGDFFIYGLILQRDERNSDVFYRRGVVQYRGSKPRYQGEFRKILLQAKPMTLTLK